MAAFEDETQRTFAEDDFAIKAESAPQAHNCVGR